MSRLSRLCNPTTTLLLATYPPLPFLLPLPSSREYSLSPPLFSDIVNHGLAQIALCTRRDCKELIFPFFLLLLLQVGVCMSVCPSVHLSLSGCVDSFFSCRVESVCVSLLAPEFFFSCLVLFLSLLVHVLCSLSPYSIVHLCSKGKHTLSSFGSEYVSM